eukprot:58227_1
MLSSRVKNMKFMKRKEESKLRDKLEKERQQNIEDSHWILPNSSKEDEKQSHIVADPRPSNIETIIPGRRSFGNFNVVVENLNKDAHQKVAEIREDKANPKADEISDREMASRLSKNAQNSPTEIRSSPSVNNDSSSDSEEDLRSNKSGKRKFQSNPYAAYAHSQSSNKRRKR